jgi:N-acetylmuramoyl-L-alanine amidase
VLGVKQLLGLVILGFLATPSIALANEQSLKVAYPPTNHKTSADRIFFIGTASSAGQVLVNGKPIKRSKAGHFAPSFPLQLGDNLFNFRYQNQEVQIKVTRISTQVQVPQGLTFVKDSLTPSLDIARLPGELICFSAIASPKATVSVKLGSQTVALSPQPQQAQLPASNAVLTGRNQPIPQSSVGRYEGCTTAQLQGSLLYGNNVITGAVIPSDEEVDLGKPEFQLTQNGKTVTQAGSGKIVILSPAQLQVAEVTAESGVARTGPSTDYSRITPLPRGVRASVTGQEGEWLRLDYGGWINIKETRILPVGTVPPRAIIRSVGYRKLPDRTEMVFPLQVAVPVAVQQGDRSFSLTLYNTTAQTDVIRLDDNPYISRLDWQQVAPGLAQYTFNLKKDQQWGYKLRYEGTSLILSLRNPPVMAVGKRRKPLSGIKILLDPGHGGKESGASGPTGYLEKDVNLIVAKLVRSELVKRGATVVMTRDSDKEVSLVERMAMIDSSEPAISISIHYNSLPDNGDLEKAQGVGTFWYNSQAHNLAVFMHNYIVKQRGRKSYGVFWNNLALTRPTAAPSVLLELGFMTNPEEFEWITNPQEQKKLATAIAQGITEWFERVR